MASPSINSSEVRVIESTNRLPPFWGSNAIFIANLLGLFFENKEQTRMLADEVGEVDSYGGRLMPIIDLLFAGPDKNLLVLEREPDRALSRYFTETAGLTLPEVAILPHHEYLALGSGKSVDVPLVKLFDQHPATRMDGYVTDSTLTNLADQLGMQTFSTLDGSREGNNKWLLHNHLKKRGLPTPITELAEKPDDIEGCLDALLGAGFRSGVVKAPMGASGIGMIKVKDLKDRDEAACRVPEHFFTEGPCLVQGWMQPGEFGVSDIYSPSAQLFLDDESVAIYDLTEQILSRDSVHEGNESPPPYFSENPDFRDELILQAGMAGQWLHSRGYRGTASVDFLLVVDDSGGFTVYVCELNARVTGATYPAVLARHFLAGGAWLLRNLRFTEPVTGDVLIDLLRTSHDLFIPGKSESGVVPVNFNTGADGLVHKGQFLCLAPSTSGSKILLEIAKLDMPCKPERD